MSLGQVSGTSRNQVNQFAQKPNIVLFAKCTKYYLQMVSILLIEDGEITFNFWIGLQMSNDHAGPSGHIIYTTQVGSSHIIAVYL